MCRVQARLHICPSLELLQKDQLEPPTDERHGLRGLHEHHQQSQECPCVLNYVIFRKMFKMRQKKQ